MINEEIKNLVNCYVDGMLSDRKATEIQRIIDHDAAVSKYYKDMLRIKRLVGCSEKSDCPMNISEVVFTTLERTMIMNNFEANSSDSNGAKHLYIRKLAAAAAIFLLIGGLSLLIFQILSPVDSSDTLPMRRILPIAEDAVIAKPQPVKITLNIWADDLVESTSMFNGLIYSQMLVNNTVPNRELSYSKYSIKCSRQQAISLMAAMETDWNKFVKADAAVGFGDDKNLYNIHSVEPDNVITILAISDRQAQIAKAEKLARLSKPGISESILDVPVEPKITSEAFINNENDKDDSLINLEIIIQQAKRG